MARHIDEFVHRVREETANTLKAYCKNPELFIAVRDGKPVFKDGLTRDTLRRAADFLIGANDSDIRAVREEEIRWNDSASSRVRVFDPARIVDASQFTRPRGRPKKQDSDLLQTIRRQASRISALKGKVVCLEERLATIRSLSYVPRTPIRECGKSDDATAPTIGGYGGLVAAAFMEEKFSQKKPHKEG